MYQYHFSRQFISRLAKRAKTDGWSGYAGTAGVTHDPHVVGKMAAHIVRPWVHRIFANLKVWALAVYHVLRRKHLQSYLDEFVFRFNRRRTRHASFRSLLGIAAALDINDLKADRLIEKFSDLETTFDEIKPSIRAKAREFLEVLDEQYRFIFNDMSPKESNN
jgi:hypothetical protein